jgi:transposase-like protein
LKMYVNGIGFRGIERVTGVHHTTVINWVRQVGGDTKRQFRILLVTLKTYWTKKHGFLVFCGL